MSKIDEVRPGSDSKIVWEIDYAFDQRREDANENFVGWDRRNAIIHVLAENVELARALFNRYHAAPSAIRTIRAICSINHEVVTSAR